MLLLVFLAGMPLAPFSSRGLMKRYDMHAEEVLLAKLDSLKESHRNWRCLRLGFASEQHRYTESLQVHAVNTIYRLLEDEAGYLYHCTDGDVFILFQGLAQPILERLAGKFDGIGALQDGTTDGLFTLFDLSLHWTEMGALCAEKVAQAKALPSVAVATVSPTLASPDAELFALAVAHRAKRKRPCVLLVEDDAFTRRLVSNTLKLDFDLIEAGDAAEAYQLYSDRAPDAVLLDIELPDANGKEVLSRLLTLDRDAFVVMLSANSMKENILGALERGAQGFVTKPFAKEKLMHYLKPLVNTHGVGA